MLCIIVPSIDTKEQSGQSSTQSVNDTLKRANDLSKMIRQFVFLFITARARVCGNM